MQSMNEIVMGMTPQEKQSYFDHMAMRAKEEEEYMQARIEERKAYKRRLDRRRPEVSPGRIHRRGAQAQERQSVGIHGLTIQKKSRARPANGGAREHAMRNPELNETVTVLVNGFVQIETKATDSILAGQVFELYKKLIRKMSGRIEVIRRDNENGVVDYHTNY